MVAAVERVHEAGREELWVDVDRGPRRRRLAARLRLVPGRGDARTRRKSAEPQCHGVHGEVTTRQIVTQRAQRAPDVYLLAVPAETSSVLETIADLRRLPTQSEAHGVQEHLEFGFDDDVQIVRRTPEPGVAEGAAHERHRRRMSASQSIEAGERLATEESSKCAKAVDGVHRFLRFIQASAGRLSGLSDHALYAPSREVRSPLTTAYGCCSSPLSSAMNAFRSLNSR